MTLRIKLILPILIILLATFLRLFRFQESVTFLGDQGRDAIILKRIITFEHLPAIGPPSSLGQIYLGPFYYYLVAPFLLLFNFNPVGPAVGVALLSLIGIVLFYFIVKREINYFVAMVFLIFLAFSAVNVQFSRFSWNPNLLPIFSFLSLYFYYKVLTTKNKWYAISLGAFLSFSIQLHHLAFLMLFTIILTYLSSRIYPATAGRVQDDVKMILISFLSFLFFSLPLVIFDLRHQFLNSRNLIRFFLTGNPTNHEGFLNRLLETNRSFYLHALQLDINNFLALFLTIFIIVFVFKKFLSKKNLFIHIHTANFILFILIFSFFKSYRNPHYYGAVYFSFFLVLSVILANLLKNKFILVSAVSIILLSYIALNVKQLDYLFSMQGGNQIKKAEAIADSIIDENPQVPFQTVALPYVETDGHIRYFLELNGKRPLPADTLEEPVELYALCFEAQCQVLGNPQWQIAAFKNAKIDKIWVEEGVKIYKLIHIYN